MYGDSMTSDVPCFVHLPIDVVCTIFRRLSLRDRLVCEQVSRSWLNTLRSLHHGKTRQASNAIWGDGVRVVINGPMQVRGKIRVVQLETVSEIALYPIDLAQTSAESAFVQWFKRLSQAFDQVTIVLRTIPGHPAVQVPSFAGGWLFPHLVAALHFAKQAAFPEPKLHIMTGLDVFHWEHMTLQILGGLVTDYTVLQPVGPDHMSCWWVVQQLTNMTCLKILDAQDCHRGLQELQCLTKLHTLELFNHRNFASKGRHFTNLLRLELNQGQDVVYDFSCLMQLTALILMEETNHNFRSLILPDSRDVGLRQLYVSCDGQHHIEDPFEILNLGLAVHLTSIHLSHAFPDNLTHLNGWPQAMPCLSHMTIEQLECCPPLELLLYPRLRHLDLSLVSLETLPDFFTGLTQLEHLVMQEHDFTVGFPPPVLALSQLQTVDMSTSAAMSLPQDLLNCATWPNLTSLNLELTGYESYSLDSQMVLLLLGNAIKESGSKVHLIVNKIYI